MQRNAVGWFEIYVQDIGRAKTFYETVFGVELTKLDSPVPEVEMLSFPMLEDAPGCPGALVKIAGVPSGGGGTLIYFSCEDCSVEANRAMAAGGQIHQEKMSIGEYGFIAMILDTEGNMVGLHSMQ